MKPTQGAKNESAMTPKKTCQAFGLESVTELAQAVGKPPRTVQNWFNSEPALFNAVLLGVAVQKAVAEEGHGAEEVLELLKLGIQVKRDAEQIARYRAEQLLV